MPGSALRLLNQGRAQGLFTPSNSTLLPSRAGGYASPGPRQTGVASQSSFSGLSSPPLGHLSLKRNRSEADADAVATPSPGHYSTVFSTQPSSQTALDPAADIQVSDGSRPSSTGPKINGEEGPSPAKRLRQESSLPQQIMWQLPPRSQTPSAVLTSVMPDSRVQSSTPQPSNGIPKLTAEKGKHIPGFSDPDLNILAPRFASKPAMPSILDPTSPAKDSRRAAIVAAICQRDDPIHVLDLTREIVPADPSIPADVDLIIDEQGHTALHLAASLGRQDTVDALISSGADIHRGNYLGETPLIRACLSTHNADRQTFHTLVASLNQSIRTLDTSRKSVIHHVVSLAGVKGRAVAARYYMDQIFLWIAEHQGGDFSSFVDLQDEHGDTALNIAARVGNRSLVRTLLVVGANRILPNKLGLRPGDFGVETEVRIILVGSLGY
jgi:regulatory protein SWI6